jgi:starch synthase (maltosyl-transferring)
MERESALKDSPAPSRVVVDNVRPEIDGGRFPVKRTVGELVEVTAKIYADGHDALAAVMRYRRESEAEWIEVPMTRLGNDKWRSEFAVEALEPYRFAVEGWVDAFRTWRQGLKKKVEAKNAEPVDFLVGAELVAAAAARATGAEARQLESQAAALRENASEPTAAALALSEPLAALVERHPDRRSTTKAAREVVVKVERERARFGAWYEMFPRSTAAEEGRHGTFADTEKRLEYVAGMGFDVLYLPPIHPIGRRHRKGPDNNPVAKPGDLGSPWAIGGPEGGHKDVNPDLGTLDDFRHLVAAAVARGIEIAMDLAYQCSPDHPWVREHPEWFRSRPDGSIQYAENPPKKYQDIYPIDFETADWRALWAELKSVVDFWIAQGVRIFRVDNPHTKAFAFWEWMIAEVQGAHPDVLFLAEAFTRPNVMYRLAKLGFSQSYNYFPWRNTKDELIEYFDELTQTDARDFFRPNLWPNTPDILPEPLQFGGAPAFQARLILAATLGASYGIYGPAFELMESEPLRPGSEEYARSEKYEIRRWDLGRADSLAPLIRRVNRIRRENPALHDNAGLRFHEIDNPSLIAYSKATPDMSNVILVVVNLDPHHVHSGWVELPLEDLGVDGGGSYQVHDLLTDARFFWKGSRSYVHIDPQAVPGHIFRVRRRVRTERDFDYFL